MTTWILFSMMCIVYFERKTIDAIGEKIWARIKFEWHYHWIRWSMRKEERKWS